MTGVLKDKVALVTGGSRGIGRAIALRLARDGATVCVHYGVHRDGADATAKEIAAAGGNAFVIGADVRRIGEIPAFYTALDAALSARGLGGLDILVNNAGIGGGGGLAKVTDAYFTDLIDTNIRGLFFLTQHALPRLRDGGRIINISSMVSLAAYPGSIAYAMTKAAVNSMTRSLAAELGARQITVNAVAPGATDTEFLSKLPAAFLKIIVEGTALGRMGQAEDIAPVVAFLAGPDGAWVTGQVLQASGGMHL